MNRHLFMAAPLALCLLSTHAFAATNEPPAEYADYIAAARRADAIDDPLQRCLAYPDLPGNTWLPGLARIRCEMFLTPPQHTLASIEAALSQPDGPAALEAEFQALLDAHFNEPAQRERIGIALRVFRDPDRDRAEHIARAWLAASPDSPFAHTALGHVLQGRGADARGTKLARLTPDENMQAMRTLYAEAAKEFAAAMEASPKLYPACEGLMVIGRYSSDDVQAWATQKCLEAAPTSFHVLEELMAAAEPRWGGSDIAMRTVAAYAKAHVADNPVLDLLTYHHAFYAIHLMEDGDAEALAVLAPAALQVPNFGYLRLAGSAYLRKDENWKAVAYLSQALRFSPRHDQEARFLAIALYELGDLEWARRSIERAVALDPADGRAQQLLGTIVRELGQEEAALSYYQRAMEDPRTRETAFSDYCGTLIDLNRRENAGKCIDDLLAAYPDHPEGLRQRLLLIGFDAPASQALMERFLALSDPEQWPHHAASAELVRGILAAKARYSIPADVFERRMADAYARFQTAEGGDYHARFGTTTEDSFKALLDACDHTLVRGAQLDFAMVMDIQPDGKVANVAVQPARAWATCLAGQMETAWTVPPPPVDAGASGYPMYYELKSQ